MAASRLNDSQKLELLKLYRFGEATSVLAARFGCSPNTVIRAVKSLLLPEEYTALKLQRGRMVDASTKKIQHEDSLRHLIELFYASPFSSVFYPPQ